MADINNTIPTFQTLSEEPDQHTIDECYAFVRELLPGWTLVHSDYLRNCENVIFKCAEAGQMPA